MARKNRSDTSPISLVYKLDDIKRTVNSILENGAYSDKNYRMQVNKKFDNYNPQEQVLVTAGFMFKKYLGLKLQKELLTSMNDDKDFLQYIKSHDENLYEQIIGLIKNGNKEQ